MRNSCFPFSMNSQTFNIQLWGNAEVEPHRQSWSPAAGWCKGTASYSPVHLWDALPTAPHLSLQQANFPQPNPKLSPQNPHLGLWQVSGVLQTSRERSNCCNIKTRVSLGHILNTYPWASVHWNNTPWTQRNTTAWYWQLCTPLHLHIIYNLKISFIL